MMIKSTRFGEIDISEDAILQFPNGMPGFSEEKSFVFLPYQPDSPFAFLQSVSDPDLSFMLLEPFTFFPDYDFEIDNLIAEELGISSENPPQIFNVVRVPKKTEEMTANLLAPIIINWRDQKAMQIILEKRAYTIRHRLFPDDLPITADRGGK